MMATVSHVTSGLGLRKFQVDGFLLTRVYNGLFLRELSCRAVIKLAADLEPNPAASGAASPRPPMPSWRAYRRIRLYFRFNGGEQ